VRRAHLVMHDFGGSWGFTWAANNHRQSPASPAGPIPDPWDGLFLPCCSGCSLRHNRKNARCVPGVTLPVLPLVVVM
jgi:hypothetical protein